MLMSLNIDTSFKDIKKVSETEFIDEANN